MSNEWLRPSQDGHGAAPCGMAEEEGWGWAGAGGTSEPLRSSTVYLVQGRWKLDIFHDIQFHLETTQNSKVCP